MYKQSKFWDRFANRYAKKPVPDQAAYEKKLKITQNYLRLDMNVLEIGCGTGSTALNHADYVKHIYATDYSKKMIDITMAKADQAGIDNIRFEQISVMDINPANESYDAVMAHSILHLLDDPAAAIQMIYRSLKPGGAFISNTACLGDSHGFFKYIGPIGHFLRVLPLISVFSTEEFERMIAEAGFEVDYRWKPEGADFIFMVAVKPDQIDTTTKA